MHRTFESAFYRWDTSLTASFSCCPVSAYVPVVDSTKVDSQEKNPKARVCSTSSLPSRFRRGWPPLGWGNSYSHSCQCTHTHCTCKHIFTYLYIFVSSCVFIYVRKTWKISRLRKTLSLEWSLNLKCIHTTRENVCRTYCAPYVFYFLAFFFR